jgi:hypothetical protein
MAAPLNRFFSDCSCGSVREWSSVSSLVATARQPYGDRRCCGSRCQIRCKSITAAWCGNGERWADLVQPTGLALMSLVDVERSDKGKTNRLFITKVQKKALLDWAREHFPEFKNGTPKDKWADPAKTAELYFTFLNGHKGSDE